jgi:hypothetical protein
MAGRGYLPVQPPLDSVSVPESPLWLWLWLWLYAPMDYAWTGTQARIYGVLMTCVSSYPRRGLRSRVRRFESCRGHSPKISSNHALNRADADRRGRESVSLTPALSQCLSVFATHLRHSTSPLNLPQALATSWHA